VFAGLFALVVSAVILAAMYYLKLGVFEMVSKHFVQMTVVTMLLGILFGVVSHVAARRLPPKLVSHRANTGQYCHVDSGSQLHVCVFLPHALSCVRFCFGAVCDFLFVYEISQELLNAFVPNSQGRCVWFLAQMSLNAKVKGQGLQGQKRVFDAFASLRVVYVW